MDNRLNVITYYGGKATLCDTISNQIEYRNSKVYIELFGGGASILLNKPKHTYEIYNEIDTGVYTLFKMLNNWNDGWELYYSLRDTVYSRDVFERSLFIREQYLMSGCECIGRALYRYVKRLENKYGYDLMRDFKKSGGLDERIIQKIKGFKALNNDEVDEGMWLSKENNKYMESIRKDADYILKGTTDILKALYDKMAEAKNKKVEETDKVTENIIDEEYNKIIKLSLKDISPLRKCIICGEALENLNKIRIEKIKFISNIQLKFSLKEIIYDLCGMIDGVYDQLYSFDMDKKPCTWEEELELALATFVVFNMSHDGKGEKFANIANGDDLFFNKTQNLLDVIERMNGVTVTNYDCFTVLEDIKKTFHLERYEDEEIFIYLDPPYLQAAGSSSKDKNYNPGMVYKHGFGYDDHKRLLGLVQSLPFKVAVSNYRDNNSVYDSYLNEENGWHSLEFETFTPVGGAARDRTEVLWMNY